MENLFNSYKMVKKTNFRYHYDCMIFEVSNAAAILNNSNHSKPNSKGIGYQKLDTIVADINEKSIKY